jgi:hypothetical protein
MLIHPLRVIIFHHVILPCHAAWYFWCNCLVYCLPQTSKNIHLRHSVLVDYFVESESSCFTLYEKTRPPRLRWKGVRLKSWKKWRNEAVSGDGSWNGHLATDIVLGIHCVPTLRSKAPLPLAFLKKIGRPRLGCVCLRFLCLATIIRLLDVWFLCSRPRCKLAVREELQNVYFLANIHEDMML